VGSVPGWAWVAAAAALIALLLLRRRPAIAGNAPISPAGDVGSGDRTAQQPKQVPWRG
jgi:hypothetical protein